MKELDVALTAYLEKSYDGADAEEQQLFLELLDLQDPTLYELVCRSQDDERFGPIVQKIRHSVVS
ncbi:succinate dehydrogenase assembly factor 2 [Granulosicoccaceae sp. 1_MG-2023]|nr:succinate dehydrogenase assembly factor 2 [Granulosicoccaceae sp. 1_MG-2023]